MSITRSTDWSCSTEGSHTMDIRGTALVFVSTFLIAVVGYGIALLGMKDSRLIDWVADFLAMGEAHYMAALMILTVLNALITIILVSLLTLFIFKRKM